MATIDNGVGPLGATCGGCIHGPWKDGKVPNAMLNPAIRFLYGDMETWYCGLTGACVTPEQRGCAFYKPRNGEVTQPFFPSTAMKPGVAPQDVGTVLLLLRAERES